MGNGQDLSLQFMARLGVFERLYLPTYLLTLLSLCVRVGLASTGRLSPAG
jgi:hypothetical protein